MTEKPTFGITFLATDPPKEFLELARVVDEGGYDYFWVADASLYGRYVYSYLTLAAEHTKNVKIGPNCTHPLTRNTAINYNAMAAIDELSGGRAIMNVGAGGGTVKELGMKPARLKYVREMITQGRELLSGNPVDYESDSLTLKGATLRFLERNDMPIYLTASGPKMLSMAGELCDGVIFMSGIDGACIEAALGDIKAGADKAGRALSDLDLACCVFGNISSDRAASKDECRSVAAWTISTQPRYAELAGIPSDKAEEIRSAFQGSAHGPEAKRAAAMVTDEWVDKFLLAGDASDFKAGIERILDAGVRHIEFFPEGESHIEMAKMFAEEVIPHFR